MSGALAGARETSRRVRRGKGGDVAERKAERARGLVCALAGASLWGVSGACAQFLLDGYGVTPAFVTAARAQTAAALFGVLLAPR